MQVSYVNPMSIPMKQRWNNVSATHEKQMSKTDKKKVVLCHCAIVISNNNLTWSTDLTENTFKSRQHQQYMTLYLYTWKC